MLAACQAKGALVSTHDLEDAPDECRDCRRFRFPHLRGGEEGRMLITAWRGTCGLNGGVCSSWRLGTVPGSHIPVRRNHFYLQTDTLPWGQLCHHGNPGNPFAQAARNKGLPSPSHPACCQGQCHCHTAVGRENSMDSDSSWVRDNACQAELTIAKAVLLKKQCWSLFLKAFLGCSASQGNNSLRGLCC